MVKVTRLTPRMFGEIGGPGEASDIGSTTMLVYGESFGGLLAEYRGWRQRLGRWS